jgi:hypothetical protein
VELWTGRLAHPEARQFKLYLREKEMAGAGRHQDSLKWRSMATLALLGPWTIDLSTFVKNSSWEHFGDLTSKAPHLRLKESDLISCVTAV